jgi:hypothetical protein
MANEHDYEKLEEQKDLFTFFAAIFFVCFLAAASNGFMEMGSRKATTGGMELLRVVGLYALPGLIGGFIWHYWGLLVGAGTGVAARIISLINLGLVVPYMGKTNQFAVGFSLDEAMQQLSPAGSFLEGLGDGFLLRIGLAAGGGVVFGVLGCLLGQPRLKQYRWFRIPRNLGVGLLTLAYVAAGGIWMVSFLPFGTKRTETKMDRAEKLVQVADQYVVWVAVAGLVLVAILIVVAALMRFRGTPSEEVLEETPGQSEEAPA